jgi:hypothetical protein
LDAVNRRHFIGGSGATLLVSGALGWPQLSALAASQGDYAFFDDRFEMARRIAAAWPAASQSIAVQNDITPWTSQLHREPRKRALLVRGVTTESFRFCAEILLGECAQVDVQVTRLDRNLVLWAMCTTPKTIGLRHV